MKKTLLFLLSIAMFYDVQAQTNRDALQNIIDNNNSSKKLEYSYHKHETSEDRGGSLICDSLLAQDTPNNGYEGVMFDIHVLNYVTLETFSISLDAGSPWVGIFYRTGSYVGYNTSSAGWIMLDSALINVPADGIMKIPVNLNLPLLADSTYAFYVTTINNTSCNYKDGTAVGAIAASDSNIEIKEGAGGDYPFNVTNSPRVLVGSVYYCQVATEINEHETADHFSIQPNPVQNIITIAGNLTIDQIEISDISGRVVFSANNERNIDCSAFETGVYFLKITSGNQLVTKKIIKD